MNNVEAISPLRWKGQVFVLLDIVTCQFFIAIIMKRLTNILSTTLAAAGVAGLLYYGKRVIWSEGRRR